MAKPDIRAERRAAILKAAGKVFLDKGFERATTLEIATAVGVSKRDLYAHFPSKDLILKAIIAASVERMATPVDLGQPQSRPQALTTLEAFGRQFLAFLLSPEPMSLYRLAIASADQHPETGRALLVAGVEGTTARVRDYITASIAAGHLRIPKDQIEQALSAYFSIVIGGLQMCQLLDPSRHATLEAIAANVRLALRVLQSFESDHLHRAKS